MHNISVSSRHCCVVGAVVLAYFMVYPKDMENVTNTLATVLQLTNEISPWLYVLGGLGLVAWSVTKIWGRCTARL